MKKAIETFGRKEREIPDAASLLNHEGAPTFRRNLEEQVIQVLTTNTLSRTFYVSRGEITRETLEVLIEMRDKDPEFLAKALVYARNHGFMQFVPLVGLAILSTARDKDPFRLAFPKVVQTPDNLLEFVALCRSGKIRKGLGGVAPEATKTWLGGLTAYHAIKYSGASEGISLRDVLRMAHPKPTDDVLRERFGWLVKGWDGIGEEPSPTNPQIWYYERLKRATDEATILESIAEGRLPWEVVVPAVRKMTTPIWEALMRQMPYMALLRNLNTLTRAGVFAKPGNVEYAAGRLSDSRAVAKAKILPFRFFEAYKAYAADPAHEPKIAEALEAALESSFANMPDLLGTVAIGSDVSGSMSRLVSEKGHTRYIDVCGVYTASLVKKSADRVVVLPFEFDVVKGIRINRGDSVFTIADRLASISGGGTAVGAPVQFLLDRKITVDTFIGITDQEDWCYDRPGFYGRGVRGSFLDLWRQYRAEVAPDARAFLLTIASYRDAVAPQNEPGVHFIYGWSPDVPRYIASQLNAGKGQVDAVEAIQLTDTGEEPQYLKAASAS